MANSFMTEYRNRIAGKTSVITGAVPNWDTDTIKVVLWSNGGANPTSTMTFISSFASTDRVKTATMTISSTQIGTIAAGRIDAADTTFTATTGDVSGELIIYQDTGGADTTDPCLLFMDAFASGMPVTPNGGDIIVQWNASGICTI